MAQEKEPVKYTSDPPNKLPSTVKIVIRESASKDRKQSGKA